MMITLTDEELEQCRERGLQLKQVNLQTKDTPAYADQSRKVYKDEADAGFAERLPASSISQSYFACSMSSSG